MTLKIIPGLPFHIIARIVNAGQGGRRRWLRSPLFQLRQMILQISTWRCREIGGKADQRLLHGVERFCLRDCCRLRGPKFLGRGRVSTLSRSGAWASRAVSAWVMPKRLRTVAMIEVWSNGTALDLPKIVPGATYGDTITAGTRTP